MRTGTVSSGVVRDARRFDTKFFLDTGMAAAKRVQSGVWPLREIGELFGDKEIWMPGRFARVWAANESYGKPLLVPYDCFRYLPWSRSFLSRAQVAEYGRAEVKRGMLLILRSGRNLGPITMVDAFLERFTISDDMVRIAGGLTEERFCLYAFLCTPTGQALIRRDRNGSVIDHLGPDQVSVLRCPVVNDELRRTCATRFREGFENREKARLLLARTQAAFLHHFHLTEEQADFDPTERARRFSITRGQLLNRLDAEPFAPLYARWRERIRRRGGCELAAVADVFKPAGRYKTIYVEDERFGVRMLNGRQIAQYRPIALRLMSPAALDSPADFLLGRGTTLVTADGRAAENLADCALVEIDREGWSASGHVHRVKPREGIHPGLVYLACSCAPVQAQFKALATGSVVDALSVDDVASVVVPYQDTDAARQLGDDACSAWKLFAEASRAEGEAVAALEAEFATAAP